MRKVILLMHISLDGFVARPNGELDWVIHDDEMWNYVTDLFSTVDTTLFGRKTYQGFESYWPTVAVNSSSTKSELDFAHWIENTPKIVFSKTLEKVEWKHSRIAGGNIAEEIEKLKQYLGQDMLIFGGATIAQRFMKLGLIDEYRINVNPMVLGSGIALFEGIKDAISLKLLKTKIFNSGVVGFHYSKGSDGKG